MSTIKTISRSGPDRPARSASVADANIGARVRERRLVAGMSLEALGEAIGVTYQQCQKYEKGTNRIGAARLQAIAEALGVSVGHFFERAGETPDEPKSHDEAVLLTGFRSLDPKVRRSVLDLVESLSRSGTTEAA